MVKNILKRWYFFPIIIYILLYLFDSAIILYINPVILEEGDKRVWALSSKTYKLKITCNFIGGNNKAYLYKVESIPKGLLNEEWGSLTDLLYSSPVGIIFGNYDLDQDRELLILGCEAGISKTAIPGLVKNIKEYGYKDISYMGYYDFQGSSFQFRQIEDSPFFSFIEEKYIDLSFIPENWVFYFMLFVTGVLTLLNYLGCVFIRYLRNKKN